MMQLVESTPQIATYDGSQYNDSTSWVEQLRGPNYSSTRTTEYHADPNGPAFDVQFVASDSLRDIDFAAVAGGGVNDKVTSIEIN